MTIILDLDHETILRKCRFDLAGIKTNERRRLDNDRMSRQMYAITCHTDIAGKKELYFYNTSSNEHETCLSIFSYC